MMLTLAEIIALDRPEIVLSSISTRRATRLVGQLRRSRDLDGSLDAAEVLSRSLFEQHPHEPVVQTVRAAVLKDLGQLPEAAEILAANLAPASNEYFLRVVGSVLWRMNSRTSAQLAFNLAHHLEEQRERRPLLTDETVTSLRERLRRTWLPDNPFFRLSEEGHAPLVTDAELAHLETPVPVSGLEGFTIRPLKSKRQLARVANHLRNCLNSYYGQVQNGTTLLFAVEDSGTPVEAIEVNPATRRVVQWKGARNTSPNAKHRPFIETTLRSISGHPRETTLGDADDGDVAPF